MAAHSSILAWRIPWTEEPGGLQSTGAHGQIQLKQLSMHAHKIVVNRFILLIKLWYKTIRLKKGKVGLWGTRCWKSISTFYSVPRGSPYTTCITSPAMNVPSTSADYQFDFHDLLWCFKKIFSHCYERWKEGRERNEERKKMRLKSVSCVPSKQSWFIFTSFLLSKVPHTKGFWNGNIQVQMLPSEH